jgi:hypothetical protein
MSTTGSPGAKLYLLLILSAVVLVSGCTGQDGGVAYGKGVAITGFESDMGSLSLESGDDVSLMLRVQNQGEIEATDVKAQIIGIDLDEWGTGFSWSEEKDLGTLQAPDPVTNTEGQTKTAQWDLEAPELPKGTEFTYSPKVRVFYDYETQALKPITLVDVEELRRIIQQGKSLSSGSTQSSAGPFSVEIRTGDFVKTQDYDDPFPLNVFITNDLWESGGSVIEGSGYYGGWGWGEELQYPVKVSITLPDGMSLESSEECSTSGEWVNLWKGKSKEITCEVRIDDPPEFRQDKVIQVRLEYRYFIDASTTIKVIGTEEDGWW